MTKYYLTAIHKNSNRAAKRGLWGNLLDSTGARKWVDCFSKQVIRDDAAGGELPRMHMPSTYRAFRSKYERHVGAKQLAKLSPA